MTQPMFRPPEVIFLPTDDYFGKQFHRVILLCEPILGEIYRKDLNIPPAKSAEYTIHMIAQGWKDIANKMKNHKRTGEGADFGAAL
jgi:hypothetical protein